MSKEPKRLHAQIYGRVQGVNFRYYTQKEAHKLEVTGWVANRSDGSVEVVGEGETSRLKRLLSFLQRGSPSARVEQVETEWSAATREFNDFRVRYLR